MRAGRNSMLVIVAAGAIVLLMGAEPTTAARELRVCADPNNLPFSNARGEGLENRLAELLARELGRRVT
jgi:mxaJ protein